MFDNCLKIVICNIFYYKCFIFINVVGLIVGISMVVLIGFYLSYELGYDCVVLKYECIYCFVN